MDVRPVTLDLTMMCDTCAALVRTSAHMCEHVRHRCAHMCAHECSTGVAPENFKKNNLEWSDHGENVSECSTHVLSKCTNFGDDPISLRVRKPHF